MDFYATNASPLACPFSPDPKLFVFSCPDSPSRILYIYLRNWLAASRSTSNLNSK
jgi:hypothetical protein